MGSKNPRKMFVIEWNNQEEKREIMSNKKKLKDLRDVRVYIDNCIIRMKQLVQKEIRELASKVGEEG